MATHSSILAQRIPWREEPGGLQSSGSQRVGYDQAHMHRKCLYPQDLLPEKCTLRHTHSQVFAGAGTGGGP